MTTFNTDSESDNMPNEQTDERPQSPDQFSQIMGQLQALTIAVNRTVENQRELVIENERRQQEIQKLATKIGLAARIETDAVLTEDKSENENEERLQRNLEILKENTKKNQDQLPPEAPSPAKEILGTIDVLNGQNDIGVEDFIKQVKNAKAQCTQPSLLLSLIKAQKIIAHAKNVIRFIQIDTYEELFDALRQNLKQTTSILALKSKLESCKQGATETVQNYSSRFRQIMNEILYSAQSCYTCPTERKIKIKMEEQEGTSRYVINLKREIGLQVRPLKPKNISEAQNYAAESEMWIRESQPIRQVPTLRPIQRTFMKPMTPPRPFANTTAPKPGQHLQNDKSKMSCHRCGKMGHFASQCPNKPQGFHPGQYVKRPPQINQISEEQSFEPMPQEEYIEQEEMTNQEWTEHEDHQEQAESQPYAESYSLLKANDWDGSINYY